MRVQVTFRVNTVTGEVEVFQVDDMGNERRVTDHDAIHEDIARAIAQVIDPRADIEEVLPAAGQATTAAWVPDVADVQEAARRAEGGTA